MKKLIKSSTTVQASTAKDYDEHTTLFHGRQKFSVYLKNSDSPMFSASVSEIHPYDEAEYTWAKLSSNGSVAFYNNGKLVDRMQMHAYDEEDYEDVNEYVNDILDTIMVALMDYNSSVTPRIDHT